MGGGFDINLSDSSEAGIIAPAGHFVAGQFPNLQDMSMQQGSEVELVKRIRGAQLFLVDGEESVLMQCGDFSLRLLKQAHPSPLAALVASVGQVQWPVGKDAPILKVWNRRYTFALPGLVYGLLFPEISTPAIVLQQLESIMDQYCTFQIHQEIAYAGTYLLDILCRQHHGRKKTAPPYLTMEQFKLELLLPIYYNVAAAQVAQS
jgi:hypothetical protein